MISHIGIAVSDLVEAIKKYKKILGGIEPGIKEVTEQKVKVAIFDSNQSAPGGRIELVAGTTPDSPVTRFVEKRGEGLHHICIYVDDIDQKLAELKKSGVKLIDESPRIGAEGNKIAFVHPSSMNGVLIELEEKSK